MDVWMLVSLGALSLSLVASGTTLWLYFRDQKRLARALLMSSRLAAIENGYVRADPKAFLVNPEGEVLRLQQEDRA